MTSRKKTEERKQKILLFLLLLLVACIFYLRHKEKIADPPLSFYGIVEIKSPQDFYIPLNQEQKGKLMFYLASVGCPIEDITNIDVLAYEVDISVKRCQEVHRLMRYAPHHSPKKSTIIAK